MSSKHPDGIFGTFKAVLGFTLPGGHHAHEGPLDQEKIVAFLIALLFFGYFALEIFIEGAHRALFDNFALSSDFFRQAWSVLTFVWQNDMRPIFLIANIILVFIGIYVLVRVWPLKQGMVLFRIKPHGHGAHGHDAHATASDTHHAPTHAPAPGHQGNPITLKHWSAIVHRANTGTPENLRWAVMEADALVDSILLKARGLQGETMADRLQNARWAGSKLVDRVFDAHRLRNELAHTPGFQLATSQAERALFAFRDFLKELKEF